MNGGIRERGLHAVLPQTPGDSPAESFQYAAGSMSRSKHRKSQDYNDVPNYAAFAE